ncbi:MAG TPA: PEP-CTERM sorting domain-containing protein [Nitrospiraceae bacterium]
MKHLKMLLAAGFLAFSVTQAWAIPTTLTVGSSPELFQFTGGKGWIDIPADGYQLTTTSSVRIDLVDRLMIGDQYKLFVSGDALTTMTTSPTYIFQDGMQTGTNTFDEAWANPSLSKGSLYLGPGTYDLDISAIRVASGVNYGSGYIRATSVPEPSTLLMLGAGILGLGLFQYRKWSRTIH